MEFKSRAEQLDYVFRRFTDFLSEVFQKNGFDRSFDEIRRAPQVFVLTKACDVVGRHKEGLKKHDMRVAMNIIMENLPGDEGDYETPLKEAVAIINSIRDDDDTHRRFWHYIDIILKLMDD